MKGMGRWHGDGEGAWAAGFSGEGLQVVWRLWGGEGDGGVGQWSGGRLENQRKKPAVGMKLGIEDYSISQATLETIFNDFAGAM
ncbi:ABC transporter A family member 1 [Dendrobium catenatum]|uniref:ABC transporter A family member 1 n=1 Tax=Dendrobium catenatum TaxID=906689 RepID=A0A2I0XG10_9ASPA|nr:ABC transporter A family member 1 [Dendrobium catenatum]